MIIIIMYKTSKNRKCIIPHGACGSPFLLISRPDNPFVDNTDKIYSELGFLYCDPRTRTRHDRAKTVMVVVVVVVWGGGGGGGVYMRISDLPHRRFIKSSES